MRVLRTRRGWGLLQGFTTTSAVPVAALPARSTARLGVPTMAAQGEPPQQHDLLAALGLCAASDSDALPDSDKLISQGAEAVRSAKQNEWKHIVPIFLVFQASDDTSEYTVCDSGHCFPRRRRGYSRQRS